MLKNVHTWDQITVLVCVFDLTILQYQIMTHANKVGAVLRMRKVYIFSADLRSFDTECV